MEQHKREILKRIRGLYSANDCDREIFAAKMEI
jgi:hypothetical protein